MNVILLVFSGQVVRKQIFLLKTSQKDRCINEILHFYNMYSMYANTLMNTTLLFTSKIIARKLIYKAAPIKAWSVSSILAINESITTLKIQNNWQVYNIYVYVIYIYKYFIKC